MKQIVLTICIALCMIVVVPATTFASEGEAPTESDTATESAQLYQLPHPGMLPDNPLYFFKTLRDSLALRLITDSELKAEKHLQLADRILMEALKLAEKDEFDLAIQTAYAGEQHMTDMIQTIQEIQDSGEEPPETLIQTAHQASAAHEGVLAGIRSRVEESHGEDIDKIEETARTNATTIADLMSAETEEEAPAEEQTEE